jgi:hypothetical protein
VLKFGAVEAIKEDYRAERGLLFIEPLLQDSRYALRTLRNSSPIRNLRQLSATAGSFRDGKVFAKTSRPRFPKARYG